MRTSLVCQKKPLVDAVCSSAGTPGLPKQAVQNGRITHEHTAQVADPCTAAELKSSAGALGLHMQMPSSHGEGAHTGLCLVQLPR